MMEYKSMLHTQRAYFQTGDTKDVEFRIRQLKKLYQWITVHEQEIMDALYMDLNKSNFEAYATEIGIVKEEIRYTLKHLRKWAAPKRVPTPITQFPSKSFIYPEPYGIVLIMSPWNYPFQLTIAPLVGAICAGICVFTTYYKGYGRYVERIVSGEIYRCSRRWQTGESGTFE